MTITELKVMGEKTIIVILQIIVKSVARYLENTDIKENNSDIGTKRVPKHTFDYLLLLL